VAGNDDLAGDVERRGGRHRLLGRKQQAGAEQRAQQAITRSLIPREPFFPQGLEPRILLRSIYRLKPKLTIQNEGYWIDSSSTSRASPTNASVHSSGFRLLFPVGCHQAVASAQAAWLCPAIVMRIGVVIHGVSPSTHHRPITHRLQNQFRSDLPVFSVKAIRSCVFGSLQEREKRLTFQNPECSLR